MGAGIGLGLNSGASFIVVYDLISENWRILRDSELRDKLRAARIRATALLHNLGVLCTESVILVSGERREEIERAISEINAIYGSVLSEVERALGVEFPRPVIRVLRLDQEQYNAFRELAERRLRETLDANIDRVSSLVERLEDLRGSANIRNLLASLRKLKREWLRIKNNVIALGIPLEEDINYLVEMIDSAIHAVREG
jgi:hypothetical protein